MREIVRAQAWSGFHSIVRELGGDPDALLAAAKVDPAQLVAADRYLPHKALIDTLEISARRLNRRDFGLLWGQRQTLSLLGPLSIAIFHAATARESIEVAARFIHIHSPASRVVIAPQPRGQLDLIAMSLESRTVPYSVQHAERAAATLHHALPGLCGPNYRAREVWFRHEPLSAPSVYQQVFGVSPRFGMPVTGIAVDRALLDAVQPGRSAQMHALAKQFLASLGAPHDESFSTKVRMVIQGFQREVDCSPGEVAATLGVHERTMQRRLKSEGASFDSIKDDVRRELAESFLLQPGLSLTQAAFLTGFSDSSAFNRSCRRWFGETPGKHRLRLLKGLAGKAPSSRS